VALADPPASGWVRLYDEQNRFAGLGECGADGRVAPRRMLASEPAEAHSGCI
jgi:tRNA pseudouridine55 synthase